jgi:hypothetical protein
MTSDNGCAAWDDRAKDTRHRDQPHPPIPLTDDGGAQEVLASRVPAGTVLPTA